MIKKKVCAISYWDTNHGVLQDIQTLTECLEPLGFDLVLLPTRQRSNKLERILKHAKQGFRYVTPYSLQIHLEQIHPEQFNLSERNLLIPNPEFMDPDVLRKCSNLDAIICKTTSAKNLLEPYHPNCVYTAFKSEDRYDESKDLDYDKCLLLEGRGDFRGSKRVVEVWAEHPEWPEITVVRNPLDPYGQPRWKHQVTADNITIIEEYISKRELRSLQNQYGTHLLLSEIEGFGHAINEAMSCRTAVFTTDAPPMNELVQPDQGFLIPYNRTSTQFMETRYFFDKQAFTDTFENYLKMEKIEKMNRGDSARRAYLKRNQFFQTALVDSLKSIKAI